MKKAVSLILALMLVFALAVPALAADEGSTQITQDGDKVTFYDPDYGYSVTLNGVLSYEDIRLDYLDETARVYHLRSGGSAVTVRNIDCKHDYFSYAYALDAAFDFGEKLQYMQTIGAEVYLFDIRQCAPGNAVSWDGLSSLYSLNPSSQRIDDFVLFSKWTSYSLEKNPEQDDDYFVYDTYTVYYTKDDGRISFTDQTIDGISIGDYIARGTGAGTPATKTAYASTQTVELDGKPVTFDCYALKDENGNPTNYIKLRDLAALLNGTAAQFDVTWDGAVNITARRAYDHPNGSEGANPFFDCDWAFHEAGGVTKVDGKEVSLACFSLSDDSGGGHTYYKLRDLGENLGFNVGWTRERGMFVETGKPYDPND